MWNAPFALLLAPRYSYLSISYTYYQTYSNSGERSNDDILVILLNERGFDVWAVSPTRLDYRYLPNICVWLNMDINPRIKKETDVLLTAEKYGSHHCVVFNTLVAKGSFRENGLEPISLATHTSSTYLSMLIQQSELWDGPISVSLYVDRKTTDVVSFLHNVHICNKKFAAKVTLHVVFERPAFEDTCPSVIISPPCSCQNFTHKYRWKYMTSVVAPFGIYPINVMRNVARRGAPTDIHIISDIEMIFSENFAVNAQLLANKHVYRGSKTVLVIRRFELDKSVKKTPRTVRELRKYIDKKQAFEFHHKLFPVGHTIAGLWQWFRVSSNTTKPIAWKIPFKGPSWEPQFLMHRSDPYSEESMPTRIRDHQALTYELCRANYSFFLVSSLFNVHRGVKKTTTNLDAAIKTHQTKLRTSALKNFISRMDEMYPDTKNGCRKFVM